MIRDRAAPPDPETLALRALALVAGDEALGPRFLSLTGMDPEALRQRAGERSVLSGVLSFLEEHEPDLITAAERLGVTPVTLVEARRALAGEEA